MIFAGDASHAIAGLFPTGAREPEIITLSSNGDEQATDLFGRHLDAAVRPGSVYIFALASGARI